MPAEQILAVQLRNMEGEDAEVLGYVQLPTFPGLTEEFIVNDLRRLYARFKGGAAAEGEDFVDFLSRHSYTPVPQFLTFPVNVSAPAETVAPLTFEHPHQHRPYDEVAAEAEAEAQSQLEAAGKMFAHTGGEVAGDRRD
jgi:hypothetical protein